MFSTEKQRTGGKGLARRTISGTFGRLEDARCFFAGSADGLVCGRFVDPGQAASASMTGQQFGR